ncbi:MAG: aminotransferase class V-fold PLP-dependent enzyme [Acidobacteria bacterium]|nr:aminotransferase class V-fold PLP-dependent enzyme [Acidobacteriota bacterium]
MVVYLDCAATTPLDPRVRAEVLRYLDEDFGNAGSRTHDYGRRARTAVESARDSVAAITGSSRGDVVFTSGATESNNLAILGLAGPERSRHIVTTRIEHHAVLEPVAELERRGFTVTYVDPEPGGWVSPASVATALRPDTFLVSVMHVNNETGVQQPIVEIAETLQSHAAYFHTDAAQGFGKAIEALTHPRLDLISISGHKIHAPKGAGALILRRRNGTRPPIRPLLHGGGQERGLRSGTLPVHLIAGLGKAAEIAKTEWRERADLCRAYRAKLLEGLAPLKPVLHGDQSRTLPNIVNLSIPGMQAEALMDAWSELVAISDGAACTSQSQQCSHVLGAMGLPDERMSGAVRLSWCHDSPLPDLPAMVAAAA